MRPLDDILIGFFIFFAIDRLMRLFSGTIVTDYLRTKGLSDEQIDNWKLGTEAAILVLCIYLVWRFRHTIARLNRS